MDQLARRRRREIDPRIEEPALRRLDTAGVMVFKLIE